MAVQSNNSWEFRWVFGFPGIIIAPFWSKIKLLVLLPYFVIFPIDLALFAKMQIKNSDILIWELKKI